MRPIVIDGFAIQTGRRYATVVVEPVTHRVLWVTRGRRREDLRPFSALVGPAGCAALEAAAMEMSEGLEAETRAHCPHVVIVHGLLGVVATFGREVIDRVRVDETNHQLFVAYVLKDALKALWRFRYRGAAQHASNAWYGWAISSGIPALVHFTPARGETARNPRPPSPTPLHRCAGGNQQQAQGH